jgi:hypothetical protein
LCQAIEKIGKAHEFFEMGLRLLQTDDCHNALLSIEIDLDASLAEAYGFRLNRNSRTK